LIFEPPTIHHYCTTKIDQKFNAKDMTIIRPCPHRDKDWIGSNFWTFYLIRTNFTLGELVFLVKVFTLFRLEWIFLVFRMWTQYIDVQHLIYWQGHCVCDVFFSLSFICTNLHTHLASLLLHTKFYEMVIATWRQHLNQQL